MTRDEVLGTADATQGHPRRGSFAPCRRSRRAWRRSSSHPNPGTWRARRGTCATTPQAVLPRVVRAGALTDAQTDTSIFLNRNGDWNLKRPDQVFQAKRTWSADELIDLDADGHPELVRAGVRINVLELIEALLTRSLDAQFSVYHAEPGGPFDPSTWAEWKIAVPISFDTFRPAGFVPTLQADMNRDGYPDFVASGKGDRIEVYLGGPEHRFRKRNGRQKLDSRGRASFGDIDGDGLQDLVMFEPRRRNAPLKIARNRGTLPGTPPTIRDVTSKPRTH